MSRPASNPATLAREILAREEQGYPKDPIARHEWQGRCETAAPILARGYQDAVRLLRLVYEQGDNPECRWWQDVRRFLEGEGGMSEGRGRGDGRREP